MSVIQLPLTSDLEPWARETWTTDHWETPWPLVRSLEEEFGPFKLDPCATARNAKAPRFFTETDDGLSCPWAPARVFCNPPYSAIEAWTPKAAEEARRGALVICLIPVYTDQGWWHDYVQPFAEVRFLRGRIYFVAPDGTTTHRPRFASAIAIYRPKP